MREITLTGTPYEMGLRHGRLLRDEIHALAEIRLRLALEWAERRGRDASHAHALYLARLCRACQAVQTPEAHAEFSGIAEGADIDPELLLIANGFTDFRDLLAGQNVGAWEDGSVGEGSRQPLPPPHSHTPIPPHDSEECSHFAVRAPATADGGLIVGQTWDMHASAEPFGILVRRRPASGPATLCFTTAGCLSLIGVNEHGLAIGNTNLIPTDARPGLVYLPLIHAALACETLAEARDLILAAPRASGHNYYLADAEGNYLDLETTAAEAECIAPEEAIYVHTNHYQSARLRRLEAPDPPETTTRERQPVLERELAARAGRLDPPALHACLAAHAEGRGSICMHGEGDLPRSCAAVILSPRTRELWAHAGPPCLGTLRRYSLAEAMD